MIWVADARVAKPDTRIVHRIEMDIDRFAAVNGSSCQEGRGQQPRSIVLLFIEWAMGNTEAVHKIHFSLSDLTETIAQRLHPRPATMLPATGGAPVNRPCSPREARGFFHRLRRPKAQLPFYLTISIGSCGCIPFGQLKKFLRLPNPYTTLTQIFYSDILCRTFIHCFNRV